MLIFWFPDSIHLSTYSFWFSLADPTFPLQSSCDSISSSHFGYRSHYPPNYLWFDWMKNIREISRHSCFPFLIFDSSAFSCHFHRQNVSHSFPPGVCKSVAAFVLSKSFLWFFVTFMFRLHGLKPRLHSTLSLSSFGSNLKACRKMRKKLGSLWSNSMPFTICGTRFECLCHCVHIPKNFHCLDFYWTLSEVSGIFSF